MTTTGPPSDTAAPRSRRHDPLGEHAKALTVLSVPVDQLVLEPSTKAGQ